MPEPEPDPQGSAIAALLTAVLGSRASDWHQTENAVRMFWARVPADQLLHSATAMTQLAGELIAELVDPAEAEQVVGTWMRDRALEWTTVKAGHLKAGERT